jgi:alpha/beta superfamily hydrolase
VISWLQDSKTLIKEVGLCRVFVRGGVALPVACADERARCVALISPYFDDPPTALLKSCRKPKLIMGGGNDDMVLPSAVEQYGREAAEPVTLEMIKGADHFWGGYEGLMADKVAGFFRSSLRA